MQKSEQKPLNEQLVRSFKMIDGDLELMLKEIGKTSSRMVHQPSGVEVGGLNFRVGYTENVIQYRGNIGFTVFEKFRGHNYSARSCQLLLPLLKHLQFSPIWITCNVDNLPSRKSIEKLGATYVDTLSIPDSYEFVRFYPPEARKKLRFRWDVL
jgi:predicted acetyltransferase